MRNPRQTGVMVVCLTVGLLVPCSKPQSTATHSWNQKAAATYLDYRERWWQEWPDSARDHGTFCVSCHTALPYSLSRPVLRQALDAQTPTTDEQRLIENIVKRVRLWQNVGPYYSDEGYDPKGAESRGTEAVINAFILANYDARRGQLSSDTRTAFQNMWAVQEKTGETAGAWRWLQFDLEPWEATDSQFYGATLAAIAVGVAPDNYRSAPEIQDNLKLLQGYLIRAYPKQSLINRVDLLWASTKLTGLLGADQQRAIVNEVLRKQQADGGWRLSSVSWKGKGLVPLVRSWIREDGTPIDGKSDGYGTAFMIFVLQEAGLPHENQQLQRGLTWLERHQNKTDGSWSSASINQRRPQSSEIGRFMSDAATAYAVLALSENQRTTSPVASVRDH
jgi:squalene-hopene/tetraprenyl-beta-curcumene cyclase